MEREGEQAGAFFNEGIIEARLGRDRKAARALARCLAMSPGDREARIALGKVQANRGRWREALEHFDRARDSSDADESLEGMIARAREERERTGALRVLRRMARSPAFWTATGILLVLAALVALWLRLDRIENMLPPG